MKKNYILYCIVFVCCCLSVSPAWSQTALVTGKHIRATQKFTLDSVAITKIIKVIGPTNTDAQLPTALAVYNALAGMDTDPSDDITTETNMAGDLLGNLPVPTVVGLQGRPVAATAPTTGYVLRWNGSAWAPAVAGTVTEYDVTVTSGNVGAALHVVASATGVTAAYATGEITITVPSGVTLLTATYRGAFGDIQGGADAGGATNWVRLKVTGLTNNTSNANMRVPVVQKTIFASGAPSLTAPYTINQGNNPAQAVVGVASGAITIRFSGMGGATNGYEITATGF